jgi:hypothetical protein
MPRPPLQRAATALREKVQLSIREQSFDTDPCVHTRYIMVFASFTICV